MPKLLLHSRSYVEFDPAKRLHRFWLAEFLRTGSWEGCPVLFELEDVYVEMIPTMIRQTAEYYSNKEFAKARGQV